MTSRAAIVLAGGSAQRFQTQSQQWQDKALAEIKGKPLIVHVISNLHSIVDELVVCVNDEQRRDQYNQVLEKHGFKSTRFVIDEKNHSVKGPLLAIKSGLHAVSSTYCLTIPTDMPFIKPSVAEYLLDAVEGFDVVVPMWPDGTLETLITAMKKESGTEITETLSALNKSRADTIPRGASKLRLTSPLREIKDLDPELKSFININSQDDLTKLENRPTQGKVTENIMFDRGNLTIPDLQLLRNGKKILDEGKLSEALTIFKGCISNFEKQRAYFWAGVSAEKLAEALLKPSEEQSTAKAKETYLNAAKNYENESKIYKENNCTLLSEQALTDKTLCETQAP